MAMQRNLAPSVTPRPNKNRNANGAMSPRALMATPGGGAGRGGRTYTASSPSPHKVVSGSGASSNPFQYEIATRPPESTASCSNPSSGGGGGGGSSPISALRMRKKPLVLSGDIRNLDSNFDISMSREPVSIAHVVAVLQKYDVSVANDEAQTLIYEFEENNDRGLSYEPFVDDFVQLLRQNAMFKSCSARLQAKKTRLAHHTRLLSTMQSQRMDELLTTLRDKLRVSWTHVRDAFRQSDPDKKGRLSRTEFTKISTSLLQVALPASVVDAFVVESDPLGHVDYNAFLTHFGSTFQHGDTNSVGFSLTYSRPLGGLLLQSDGSSSSSDTPTNKTLHSPGVTTALNSKSPLPVSAKAAKPHASDSAVSIDPLYMEKLRLLLYDPLSSRMPELERALTALDRDASGRISTTALCTVLVRDFQLATPRDQLEQLIVAAVGDPQGGMNHHHLMDYRALLELLRDELSSYPTISPSKAKTKKKHLLENSSLVFTGERDIKGANKNRTSLSSPGNELKEAFSGLSDETWRAIYVELDHSDTAPKTGVVPSAELLRVLAKYLGDLPKQHYASLFRACGSHTNQLLNYRQLVKSYRQSVMDPVEYFQQDSHLRTDRAFRKSPTESLVMVWSIRVQRAQVSSLQWLALKEDLWKADTRRVGRIGAASFKAITKQRLALSEDQAAFLCFFYEDTNLSADQITVRYGSFLTDYEDSGLEAVDGAGAGSGAGSGTGSGSGSGAATPRRAYQNQQHQTQTQHQNHHQQQQRTEGKGRVRPPGYGIHNSHHHSGVGGPGVDSLDADGNATDDESKLRAFFGTHIRSLESLLERADPDKRGFLSLDQFVALCKTLETGKLKISETSRAFTALVAKYIAQSHFYYRGFLLDFDTRAGLQSQALVVQDDDDDGEDGENDGEGNEREGYAEDTGLLLDVYQAKEALRHHLTASLSRQKVVYKLLQRMDPGKSGVLGYAELRRALERLEICVTDDVARELCGSYEEEDESTGNRTGRVKYLLLLHAHGGRDPDKLDGMSDLTSNCSYYSAISISPRAVMKNSMGGPVRASHSRDHVVAARAVSNLIDKPRGQHSGGSGGGGGSSGLSGAAAASAVERKIQLQLTHPKQSKHKWKHLARAFQQIDSDRRGAVSPSSFRKVLEDVAGVVLDQEDVVRLQLKYDIEQNGQLNYHEFLRNLTNSMSDLSTISEDASGTTTTLPTIASPRSKQQQQQQQQHNAKSSSFGVAAGATAGGVMMGETLRQGVKAKWKAIYASLKTLDKTNVGRVSAAHFRQLLEWYALTVSEDEFLQLLRQFDHDDDGGVDYNKFMKACFA